MKQITVNDLISFLEKQKDLNAEFGKYIVYVDNNNNITSPYISIDTDNGVVTMRINDDELNVIKKDLEIINHLCYTHHKSLDNVSKADWLTITRTNINDENFFLRNIDYLSERSWSFIFANQRLSETFIEKYITKTSWYFVYKFNKYLTEEFKDKHIQDFWLDMEKLKLVDGNINVKNVINCIE